MNTSLEKIQEESIFEQIPGGITNISLENMRAYFPNVQVFRGNLEVISPGNPSGITAEIYPRIPPQISRRIPFCHVIPNTRIVIAIFQGSYPIFFTG